MGEGGYVCKMLSFLFGQSDMSLKSMFISFKSMLSVIIYRKFWAYFKVAKTTLMKNSIEDFSYIKSYHKDTTITKRMGWKVQK